MHDERRGRAVARGSVKEDLAFRAAFGPLRIAAALALALGSFVALRQRYHGDCVIPNGDLFFFFLPALFLAGFVWLISEAAYFPISMTGMHRLPAILLSVGVALAAYVAVACVVWLSSPTTADDPDDGAVRAFMSAFWSAGVLLKSGNFSDVSCGY